MSGHAAASAWRWVVRSPGQGRWSAVQARPVTAYAVALMVTGGGILARQFSRRAAWCSLSREAT
jgi:hypothetical protein